MYCNLILVISFSTQQIANAVNSSFPNASTLSPYNVLSCSNIESGIVLNIGISNLTLSG